MPANHPYDPRYNAKIYVPKLTEEERRAWATPLENLRSLRFRSDTPAAPAAHPTPTQTSTAKPATPEPATPEPATPEPATPEPASPEPATHAAPEPDYTPSAWEVVFAQFPELYPEHAECVGAVVAEHGPRSHPPEPRRARIPCGSAASHRNAEITPDGCGGTLAGRAARWE